VGQQITVRTPAAETVCESVLDLDVSPVPMVSAARRGI
jgi:hypothetical protein